MTPIVGATYERENERRTVVKVTPAGTVTFTVSYMTHDFDGPDPSKLVWQPSDESRKEKRIVWAEWSAWAAKVVDTKVSQR